jgi:hypothetical protein
VTAVGGTPIPPPDPATRKKKKVKPAAPAEGIEEPKKDIVGESTEEGAKKKRNRKKAAPKKEAAPKKSDWYSELDEAVQKSMEAKSIKIDSGRIFISIGDARLKVGTGGYITLAHASGLVAEGKYDSGKDGKLAVTWEKVLKLDGADWKASSVEAVNGALLSEIDLTSGKFRRQRLISNCCKIVSHSSVFIAKILSRPLGPTKSLNHFGVRENLILKMFWRKKAFSCERFR